MLHINKGSCQGKRFPLCSLWSVKCCLELHAQVNQALDNVSGPFQRLSTLCSLCWFHTHRNHRRAGWLHNPDICCTNDWDTLRLKRTLCVCIQDTDKRIFIWISLCFWVKDGSKMTVIIKLGKINKVQSSVCYMHIWYRGEWNHLRPSLEFVDKMSHMKNFQNL